MTQQRVLSKPRQTFGPMESGERRWNWVEIGAVA